LGRRRRCDQPRRAQDHGLPRRPDRPSRPRAHALRGRDLRPAGLPPSGVEEAAGGRGAAGPRPPATLPQLTVKLPRRDGFASLEYVYRPLASFVVKLSRPTCFFPVDLFRPGPLRWKFCVAERSETTNV